MNSKLFFDVIGWTGSLGLVLAYGLNSYQKIKSDSFSFLFTNFLCGILLIGYTLYYKTYANAFVNIVWVVIAIPALIKLARKRARGSGSI